MYQQGRFFPEARPAEVPPLVFQKVPGSQSAEPLVQSQIGHENEPSVHQQAQGVGEPLARTRVPGLVELPRHPWQESQTGPQSAPSGAVLPRSQYVRKYGVLDQPLRRQEVNQVRGCLES